MEGEVRTPWFNITIMFSRLRGMISPQTLGRAKCRTLFRSSSLGKLGVTGGGIVLDIGSYRFRWS